MSFVLLTDSQVSTAGPPPSHAGRLSYQSPSSRQTNAPTGTTDAGAGANDGDDDDGNSQSKLQEMERMNKLYEILSARSDIDHPICVECTELLVERQEKQLEMARRERDAYVACLKQLSADVPSEDEVRAAEKALEEARRTESEAMAALLALEKEKAALDAELLALEEESRQLDVDEEAFWRERNDFSCRLAEFQAERDSINARFDHDSRLLEKLRRSNVYNDTFCISHDGTFATINGLRLGRLSSRPVDWPEINAAWGHALLLLVTVADRLGYRFEGFEPVPMGSTSRIIRYEMPSPTASRAHGANPDSSAPPAPPPPIKKHVYELYYSSSEHLVSLPFLHRSFDRAMAAFLELVRQLGEFVRRRTANREHPLSLPYPVDGDRVGDVSIRLSAGSDEQWTRACKYALTCCKFLLAHASNEAAAAADAAGGGPGEERARAGGGRA